jgi:hypothetical protein
VQPVSRKGDAGKMTWKEVEEVVEKEEAAVTEEVSKEVSEKVANAAMLEVSGKVAAVLTEQTELAEVAPGLVSEILMDQMELPARAASKVADEVTVAPARSRSCSGGGGGSCDSGNGAGGSSCNR